MLSPHQRILILDKNPVHGRRLGLRLRRDVPDDGTADDIRN